MRAPASPVKAQAKPSIHHASNRKYIKAHHDSYDRGRTPGPTHHLTCLRLPGRHLPLSPSGLRPRQTPSRPSPLPSTQPTPPHTTRQLHFHDPPRHRPPPVHRHLRAHHHLHYPPTTPPAGYRQHLESWRAGYAGVGAGCSGKDGEEPERQEGKKRQEE